jgi:hypothetical protein
MGNVYRTRCPLCGHLHHAKKFLSSVNLALIKSGSEVVFAIQKIGGRGKCSGLKYCITESELSGAEKANSLNKNERAGLIAIRRALVSIIDRWNAFGLLGSIDVVKVRIDETFRKLDSLASQLKCRTVVTALPGPRASPGEIEDFSFDDIISGQAGAKAGEIEDA